MLPSTIQCSKLSALCEAAAASGMTPPSYDCDNLHSNCFHYEKKNDHRNSITSMRMASHRGVMGVSIVAVAVNIIFLLLIAIGFKRNALKSKRYLFFAGRSLIDLLVAVYSILFIATKYTDCVNENGQCHSMSGIIWGVEIFQTLITLDCLVISAIYSSVAALTYVAVKRPLHYQMFAQSKKIMVWLVGIFTASLLISILLVAFVYGTTPNGIVQLLASSAAPDDAEHYGDQALTSSDYDNVAFLIGPTIAFVLAIGSYGYIVAFLLTQATFNARRQRPSVWRLGVNIGLFTLSMTLLGVLSLGVFHMDRSAAQTTADKKGQVLLDVYNDVEKYTLIETIATIGWFVRMSADPLCDMFLDSLLVSLIVSIVCRERCGVRPYRSSFDRRNRTLSTQYTNVSIKNSQVARV